MLAALRKLTLIASLAAAGHASAETVTLEHQHWWVTIESEQLILLGSPALDGNAVVFKPGLNLNAPADQINYADSRDFALSLSFTAKPNYQIMGYDAQAKGTTYVGDDARLGISGSFNQMFYGASYFSGALSGDGSWQDGFGTSGAEPLSLNGSLYVETTNHYNYQQLVGYNEHPIYEYNYVEVLIGTTTIYDEEGNIIREDPLYETRYVETIVGYNYDPIYQTFYQTSGADISLDEIRVSVAGTFAAVPVPPAAVLLGSAVFGLFATRRAPKRNAA
jgi:hypothetical protein